VFYHFDRYYLCCIFSDSAFWLHVCLIFSLSSFICLHHPSCGPLWHYVFDFSVLLLMYGICVHAHPLPGQRHSSTNLPLTLSFYFILFYQFPCTVFSWVLHSSEKSWKMKKNSSMQKSWNWLLILKSPDFWSVWSWKINLASMLVVMHLLILYKYFVK